MKIIRWKFNEIKIRKMKQIINLHKASKLKFYFLKFDHIKLFGKFFYS